MKNYSCCDNHVALFVTNLTSSYLGRKNEASIVAGSVMMFLLAGIFFNLNLFSGISDVSAILDPKVRLILSSALSFFLPVMSYLFAEAKNAHASAVGHGEADLPLQAGIILVWMLLVELVRKKVDAIRMPWSNSILQRAGRVVWLGSLVFFNVHSAGRKIVYGILWILCATTLVQRFAFHEVEKRSYAHGKNAWVIASYMARILRRGHHPTIGREGDGVEGGGGGDELLNNCRYVVMGEVHLVGEAAADGYEVSLPPDVVTVGDDISLPPGVVTVGDVWRLAEGDPSFADWDREQRLRRLCLSFALFKLLRRRFELRKPLSQKEAFNSRELIFRGLYSKAAEAEAEAVFQVINDEVNFLSEYYHSVVPVIFASPFFLFINYFLLPMVVLGLCLIAVTVFGNGDLPYALTSIHTDNYTFDTGVGTITYCLLTNISIDSPQYFYSIVDLSITFLLSIIFVYESVWELAVFLLSNWFMVSIVCDYTTAKQGWPEKHIFWRWAFRWFPWLRSVLSHGELCIKEFSVLGFRCPFVLAWPSMLSSQVRTRTVPVCVKQSIMEYLVARDHDTPISIGKSVLDNNQFKDLSWAFGSKSIAEVILTWHVATSIFEENFPSHHTRSKDDAAAAPSSVATTMLCKYCAYLVVFQPEILPDNQEKTERVVKAMKEELGESFGFREFCSSGQAARVRRMTMKLKGQTESWTEKKVVKNGVTLGASLVAIATREDAGDVWKMLADVWTELVVYIALSTDGERMSGPANSLVQGSDLLTVLWALATHTGIFL